VIPLAKSAIVILTKQVRKQLVAIDLSTI
jgi:hypothetical protein